MSLLKVIERLGKKLELDYCSACKTIWFDRNEDQYIEPSRGHFHESSHFDLNKIYEEYEAEEKKFRIYKLFWQLPYGQWALYLLFALILILMVKNAMTMMQGDYVLPTSAQTFSSPYRSHRMIFTFLVKTPYRDALFLYPALYLILTTNRVFVFALAVLMVLVSY